MHFRHIVEDKMKFIEGRGIVNVEVKKITFNSKWVDPMS